MDDLISSSELADEFDRPLAEIEEILGDAGISPRRVKFGTVTVTVYDRDAAIDAITRLLISKAPPLDPALAQELEELRKKLDSVHHLLSSDLSDVEEKVDTALVGLAKLSEQNALLLRAIQALRDDLTGKVGDLGDLILEKLVPSTAQAPAEAVSPASPTTTPSKPVKTKPASEAPSKPAKRRIGIVGLLASQEQVIRKEFGDAFDLRFFTSDQAKGKSFQSAAGNCEKVLTMTAFINHTVEHSITAAGGTLVRVSGGVTSIRDELHKVFASKPEETTTA